MIAFGAILLLVFWQIRHHPQVAPAGATAGDVGAAAGDAPRDLASDERLGGHTLARHVGRSDRDLAERLAREAGVAAASSFVDRATAERVVGITLAREEARIASWMRRGRGNLALDFRGAEGHPVGRVLQRGDSRARAVTGARVVLRKRGDRFFVLTSYPVEP